jgi:hypothetical protein
VWLLRFHAGVKPLPPAASRNPELEREALRVEADSGINADPLYARIVSPFSIEQNELTGIPVRRHVELAVVVKSRVLDDTCT